MVLRKPGNPPQGTRRREAVDRTMGLLEGQMTGTLGREIISTRQEKLVELTRIEPERVLTTLAHHIDAVRLEGILGVGVLTATALAVTVVDGQDFRNGRQLAAYLGLVPRQASSGGKDRLLGISKRGDGYLCSLLIHGARSVIRHIRRRLQAGQPGGNPWGGSSVAALPSQRGSCGTGQKDGENRLVTTGQK